jgi:hypothetical protein
LRTILNIIATTGSGGTQSGRLDTIFVDISVPIDRLCALTFFGYLRPFIKLAVLKTSVLNTWGI